MSGTSSFFRIRDGGAQLFVRVTPKASADAIEGIAETAGGGTLLKVRLRAVPEKGRANAALERLLAGALGLPRRNVKVTAGAAGRLKTVTVTGDPAQVAESLARLAAAMDCK